MAKKTSNKNSSYSGATAAATGTNSGSNGKQQQKSTSSTASAKKGQATLRKLFEKELKDVYNAEQQLLKALPEMAKAADNEDLQDAFEFHATQTKKHVERLEKIFDRLGIEKEGETCEAMEGLITECKEVLQEFDRSPVRDSALIIGAQKIEHYEIASYGSLCELADVLGMHKVCDILDRTLEEEEQTDHDLTEIAQDVNDDAAEMGMSEESEEEETTTGSYENDL